jgi:hypothetical protein
MFTTAIIPAFLAIVVLITLLVILVIPFIPAARMAYIQILMPETLLSLGTFALWLTIHPWNPATPQILWGCLPMRPAPHWYLAMGPILLRLPAVQLASQ